MPENAPQICFDRILPQDLNRPRRMLRMRGRLRAVIEFKKMWITGSTLKVRFMGGTPEQHAIVKEQASWWSDHANLNFDFNNAPDADIRISFNPNDGAWSYIGTDSKKIPFDQPTMNLGFLDRGTPAHEFGHAIGLGHEHQNPEGGIEWNRDKVIQDLSGPPNFWSVSQIEHNVLNKYSIEQSRGTEFDPKSIMLYAFPASWTLNGVSTSDNEVLSAQDIAFIASADAYPGRDGQEPSEIVELPVIDTSPTSAEIGQPGEEDVFSFVADRNARHIIETSGKTDLVMKLFGPDSQTQLIAEDDDGGEGTNSRIIVDLAPGRYFVQIRHFNSQEGTGEYHIKVSR